MMIEELINEKIERREETGTNYETSEKWIDALPEDLRQMVLHKGWRNPSDALKSYKHLEEFLGADKSERGVVLPKGEDDLEGYSRLYQALGRPENPDGYGLGDLLGNVEIDQAFTSAMSQAMHQAGLNKRQAHDLTSAWQKQLDKYISETESLYEREKEELLAEISPAKLEAAKRGFRSSATPLEMAEKIERALGPKMAVELFASIGSAMAEDRLIDSSQSIAFTSSPQDAKRRMDRLMNDAAFSQRYLKGDKTALDEISELARRAATPKG